MDTKDLDRERAEHPGEDRLLDFVLGLLPPAKASACLTHLCGCADCEGRARSLASEHAGFRSMAHTSDALADLASEKHERATGTDGKTSANRPSLRPRWLHRRIVWAVPIMVSAVLLAVLIRQTGRNPADGLEAAWLVNPSSIIVSIRDQAAGDLDPDLRAGLEAYEHRDLDGAARSLSRARAQDELESLRSAYLGNVLARRRRYREAVNVLRTLRAPEIPEDLRDETRWTFFVALSRAGLKAGADSLLTLLVKEPGAIGERARRFNRR